MIARLTGTPVARTADGLVLDVNGVGYLLAATPGAVRAAEGGGEAVAAGVPSATGVVTQQTVRASEHEKLGRNDPCWCGSGKKFKKCHGA